jgi:hypothetical protein
MTDLTKLGVAAIRSGVANGEFTAVEVAKPSTPRRQRFNAFIVETPEKAIEAAKAVDATVRLASRWARWRRAHRHEGSVRHRRRADHRREPHPRRLCARI